MSASLTWTDVALRLALSVLVGIVVGFNRSEHGKPAGMRTTLLVCLAASVAMIQVNLLLPTAGRSSDSFVMNDLMRLPLGILTGVGFIGGGAILRRDNITVGVTTAATLWLVTVIGLCIGGGQIVLGLAATGLCLFALWVLRWVENAFRQERRARLSIEHRHSGGEGDSPKARERGLVDSREPAHAAAQRQPPRARLRDKPFSADDRHRSAGGGRRTGRATGRGQAPMGRAALSCLDGLAGGAIRR